MSRGLTDWLWALAWTHFAPTAVDATSVEWTTEQDPACTITGTDDERIALLRRTKSFASRLSPNKITFDDLWTANADKLAHAWPAEYNAKSGLTYDASSADQSFFNHLSWGFGNNCDAMERIASRDDCALRREKWQRIDYLRRTITNAVAVPKTWKKRTSSPPLPAPRPPPPPHVQAYQQPAPILAGGVVPPQNATQPVAPPPPGAIVPALPTMLANGKDKFEASLDYVRRVLETDGLLSFDTFRGEPMLQRGVVPMPMTDEDYIDLRTQFEREKNFNAVGKEIMRDAVLAESARRKFDSGIEWLSALVWDGVPRVETFIHTHFGGADDEYTRSVGRYMWTGLAGRTLDPGCQLDMVIALQSKQGTKKSTGLKALAPHPDQFTDGLSLHEDNDNFKRLLRGKVIVEIAELAGLSKGDVNVVKRAITRTDEKWIEKYQTKETTYKRRCMLFASTNEQEFLPPDETGQRRWLPVVIAEINRELITRDCAQLWAEGAAIWRESGIYYAEPERLAAGRHKAHELSDVWEQRIGEWLQTTPPNGQPPYLRPLTLAEVLEGAIRMQPGHMDQKAEKRAGRVLRQLGYESRPFRVGGVQVRRWALNVPPPPQSNPS